MTQEQVIKKFRHHSPQNVEQALVKTGVSLTFIAEGAFRRAYQIGSLPLVVKFPYYSGDNYSYFLKKDKYRVESFDYSINHSAIEMKALNRILRSKRRYKSLQQYMPKVYYFNAKTGVVITHKYDPLPSSKESERLCYDIETAVCEALCDWGHESYDDYDCSTSNVGKDEDGRLVIMDLGCFEDEK